MAQSPTRQHHGASKFSLAHLLRCTDRLCVVRLQNKTDACFLVVAEGKGGDGTTP